MPIASFRACLGRIAALVHGSRNGQWQPPSWRFANPQHPPSGCVAVHHHDTSDAASPFTSLLRIPIGTSPLLTPCLHTPNPTRSQSLHWGKSTAVQIEGDELDYAIKDGLLGTSFTYNLFTGAEREAAPTPRLRLLLFQASLARVAGTSSGSSSPAAHEF